MTLGEAQVSGLEAMELATRLLQRARVVDPMAGLWEAADIQWSWRMPRLSDDIEKTFWIDANGPVAGIWMTSSQETTWQVDPIVIPGADDGLRKMVWERAIQHITERPSGTFDIPVNDDDVLFFALAREYNLTPGGQDSTGWMNAASRPPVAPVADGFTIVDRTMQPTTLHPMRDRNGEAIEERLRECSLYDPSPDLAVITNDGQTAGYSLYWFDPVTRVGLVEPVRIEDRFQRKGLARAMLTAGISRLVDKGAERIKVSWESEAASALYRSVGFQQTSTTTWYRTQE
ncbi:MAG: GNAT family N-acetyltransferase [Thermomicrobiales bacterium]|nr:GNAT family N-acetyltransferase [Thermomicrobiales bacterium]MCO5228688.1 GNAT family N-acetyltransferase [Thermomicrobiales bacterium]